MGRAGSSKLHQVNRENEAFLYQQVVDLICQNIQSGTLRPGDRLPSLRRMSGQIGVSVPTVRQAYIELERQRKVVSKPQSGFYVRSQPTNNIVRAVPPFRRHVEPARVACRSLLDRVYDGINHPELVPLGIANPCMAKPAAKALYRSMKRVMPRAQAQGLGYATTLGDPGLRRQLAYRYLDHTGINVDPEQVCITNGGQEALLLAISSVACPGDVIAVESPTYHGLLELIDSLGMLAIEVESCPETGVCAKVLDQVLSAHDIKACVFSTTLGNPLGVSMSEDARRELVAVIEKHNTVLIEDDVYGELRFDGTRPKPAQFYARSDRVMTCGSFSKTAAAGFRVGWVLAGDRIDELGRHKRAYSCSSGLLQQLTLSDFVATGDYDRYLRGLRPVLKVNCERMTSLVAQHFPAETRVSKPAGGSVLWLELPATVNAVELFDRAIDAGISIMPGPIFSPRDCYLNFVRISFGHPWSDRIEQSLQWLGQAVTAMAGARG